ncbi:MAG: type II secretion system F family protein [Oscillospiraceae bacterium]|nr:type II secretion system F family protein [Oscillospiraceae bacterium]
MTTYRYKGMTSSGANVEGVVEAFDQQDAVARAKENCRVLISVEPVSGGKLNDIMNADIGDLFSGGKIKPKTLALLCSQLGIELRAGLPLVSSLRLVAENEEDKKIKRILTEVADDVHAGNGLADSFAARGPGLPRTFIETLRAGEESGKLDDTFQRLQKYYENADAVSSKVGSAMVYPAMLLSVAVIVVAIIMLVAVPVFEKSFAQQGNELPLPTKMLIAMSNFMVDNILLLIAIIAAVVLGLFFYGKSDSGKHLYARLFLTFPGVDMINRMNAASQFASTLSTMLASGLPLVSAARITANTADNLLIAEDIEQATAGVIEGNRLSDGLKNSKWFPTLLKEMVTVGEETGKLEDTLNVVSEYYTKEVDVAVKRALEILNPAITMVLAAIVVFILLSVYLPIFSMY